jgi:hypothetical protein
MINMTFHWLCAFAAPICPVQVHENDEMSAAAPLPAPAVATTPTARGAHPFHRLAAGVEE